jgi:hypothetical protein
MLCLDWLVIGEVNHLKTVLYGLNWVHWAMTMASKDAKMSKEGNVGKKKHAALMIPQ